MSVRVVPGWIIEEGADGSERRVPLGDLLMVDLDPDSAGGGWVVTVYLKGEEEGQAWLLEDEDEANELVDAIARNYDAGRQRSTSLSLLGLLVLEDLEVAAGGGDAALTLQE